MKRVLDGEPVKIFPVPDGIVFSNIDADTGLLPIAESKNTVYVCFKEGTVPTDHTKPPGEITETEDFFKKDL
jgi:penicillin-binding protein 1A